jgi:tRNA pseudouridine38-40 synthase
LARYFIELAYNGARYAGWQRQPGHLSVQEALESDLSKVLRTPIALTGCGRTDAGVHASQYFAHLDFGGEFPPGFVHRINKLLPGDIAIKAVHPMPPDAHARFDANYRAYRYHLIRFKDPFRQETAWHFPFFERLDTGLLQEAARLLLDYQSFFPFCKTGSDAKTAACTLFRSEWELGEGEYVYHIAANRFLRGMVRLIVGMCLTVAQGKQSLAAVKEAMDKQQWLAKSLSADPRGLFLSEVRYSFEGLGARS